MTPSRGKTTGGHVSLPKSLLLLLTGLTCYSSSIITLLIMDRAVGVSYGFPLTRQLLNDYENGGSEQQQQLRRLVDAPASNVADGDDNRHSESSLASQFRHFRHRHERKRMNRVKEALVSVLLHFFVS